MRLMLALTIFLFACSKKESVADDPQNYSSQIAGKWKLAAMRVNPAIDWDKNGIKETNIFPLLDSCDGNGVWIIGADRTFQYTSSLCFLYSAQGLTWNVTNNSTQFNIIYPTNPPTQNPFTIVSFSPPTLIVKQVINNIAFSNIEFTSTYIRQ